MWSRRHTGLHLAAEGCWLWPFSHWICICGAEQSWTSYLKNVLIQNMAKRHWRLHSPTPSPTRNYFLPLACMCILVCVCVFILPWDSSTGSDNNPCNGVFHLPRPTTQGTEDPRTWPIQQSRSEAVKPHLIQLCFYARVSEYISEPLTRSYTTLLPCSYPFLGLICCEWQLVLSRW